MERIFFSTDSDDPAAELDRGYTGLGPPFELEWLETNGRGDYASGTPTLCPTRRYHGLLVARPDSSAIRHVFLSRFEEVCRVDGESVPLSCAAYPGTLSPRGDLALSSFALAPHPRAVLRAGSAEIVREIQMVRGARTVLIRYRLRGQAERVALELQPFLPYREADALTVRNAELDGSVAVDEATLTMRPYAALPALYLSVAGSPLGFEAAPAWYENVSFARDAERGYPAREDSFTPGRLTVELTGEQDVVLAASIDGPVSDPRATWSEEAKRRAALLDELEETGSAPAVLRSALAAEDFLIRSPDAGRGGRAGVDAGYPWFGEWGRDTFIALPGLTLARGRLEDCAEVLSDTLEYLRDGLLPNVYGLTRADSHYNSVDASLWFARAVHLYERGGGDAGRVVDEYMPALAEIAEAYWDGTALDVRADEGALIRAGNPDVNPTWMDAQVDGRPVTPRAGCAVEINALWYSLLQHTEHLYAAKGDRAAKRTWTPRRRRAKRSFLERFWVEDEDILADVWDDGRRDERVRPNMVIAAALEYSPLVRARRAAIVRRSAADLLTPRGLRTLAPDAEGYRGRFEGGPAERDGAYHQGTVWPFLLGFHTEAALRASGGRRAMRDELSRLWDGLEAELDRAGLNHFSEVFDGDPPHRPGGTVAQAWNTAEHLRARAMLARGRA